MDTEKLFNCCPRGEAPDWSQFDALEIGGCVTLREAGEEWTEGGQDREDAEFFTVYGRFKNGGGWDAITDCPTFEDAVAAANVLTELSSLKCHISC